MGYECQPANHCSGVIMAANFFIKGRDNPVVINFTFTDSFDLDDFDRIVFEIGNETYDSAANAAAVVYAGSKLTLSIGDTTALAAGKYTPIITGYSANYDDGYVLTSKANAVLGQMEVRDV